MNYQYSQNGQSLNLDESSCTGCRRCTEVCPHGVLEVYRGKAVIMNREACIECGACARNCEHDALSVVIGVGCAAAIIHGMLTRSAPSCGCGNSSC